MIWVSIVEQEAVARSQWQEMKVCHYLIVAGELE